MIFQKSLCKNARILPYYSSYSSYGPYGYSYTSGGLASRKKMDLNLMSLNSFLDDSTSLLFSPMITMPTISEQLSKINSEFSSGSFDSLTISTDLNLLISELSSIGIQLASV